VGSLLFSPFLLGPTQHVGARHANSFSRERLGMDPRGRPERGPFSPFLPNGTRWRAQHARPEGVFSAGPAWSHHCSPSFFPSLTALPGHVVFPPFFFFALA